MRRHPNHNQPRLAPMTDQEFKTVYRLLADWIRKTLA